MKGDSISEFWSKASLLLKSESIKKLLIMVFACYLFSFTYGTSTWNMDTIIATSKVF